jgi:hypothetical protein
MATEVSFSLYDTDTDTTLIVTPVKGSIEILLNDEFITITPTQASVLGESLMQLSGLAHQYQPETDVPTPYPDFTGIGSFYETDTFDAPEQPEVYIDELDQDDAKSIAETGCACVYCALAALAMDNDPVDPNEGIR